VDRAVSDGIVMRLLAPLTKSIFRLDEYVFICLLGGEEGITGRMFDGRRACLLGELGGVDPNAGFLDDEIKTSRCVAIMRKVQWQNARELEDVVQRCLIDCGVVGW
jgi:hypothetical protein